MYYRISVDKKRENRKVFKSNPIYCILFTPLWRRRGDNLSPEEVWVEANNLACDIKNENNVEEIGYIVKEKFDDLCVRFSAFTEDGDFIIRRSYKQAEQSAMMVSFAAFLLLLNVYPEFDNHPRKDLCQALIEIISEIDGFSTLYEEVRQEEDKREDQGKFIEVADFIEQLEITDEPLSDSKLEYAHRIFGEIVDGNKYCSAETMRDNEWVLSRVNDKHDHRFQREIDLLRKQIDEVNGNGGQNIEYKNLIFKDEYTEKVSLIRKALYPFVFNGVEHITVTEQRQWLAIIEPLKQMPEILIVHEEKEKRKECTNEELCNQMEEFFGKELPAVDFSKIPKSISEERKHWRNNGVGLTFEDWNNYITSRTGEKKYKALAIIAKRVYGEVKKVIKR